MPTGLRVRLTPLLAQRRGEGRHLADGARLSFESLGEPPTQTKIDTPLAAKLTLSMELITRVRGESERESSVVAELVGRLELNGPERKPLFTIESGLPEPIEEVPEEAPAKPELEQRVLRFEFDRGQFAEIAPEFGTEFIVVIDVRKFTYMEVLAKLEVLGQTEAQPGENEVLDVLITADNPPPIEDAVFVIQRDGEPVPDAEVELENPRGRVFKRTTDEQGIVRARGRSGEQFSLLSVTEKKQIHAVAKFTLEDPDESAVA